MEGVTLDSAVGRLLQGEDSNTLVWTTWAEVPDLDHEGNPIDHTPKPTIEEQISSLEISDEAQQADINATQLALTEVFEMLIGEE